MGKEERLFKLIVLAFVAFAVVGCGASPPPAAIEPAVVVEAPNRSAGLATDLSVSEVQALLEEDALTVVDVREPWEYAEGHIPGAVLIPLGELPDRLAEIPEDEAVVTVCRSGNRSSRAQEFLEQQGFASVHNMLGGMLAWEEAEYPIER